MSEEETKETQEKVYSVEEYEALAEKLRDTEEKWEKSESERKAFEYRTKLTQYVKNLRLKDDIYEQYVADMLEKKGLKFEGDKLVGGDEIMKDFRKNHGNAFIPDAEERVSASTSGKAPRTVNAVEQAFYAKNPHLFHKN